MCAVMKTQLLIYLLQTNAMCQINYYVSAVTGPNILFLLKKMLVHWND